MSHLTWNGGCRGAWGLRVWALEVAFAAFQVKRPALQGWGGAHTCNLLQALVYTLGPAAADKQCGPSVCGLGPGQPVPGRSSELSWADSFSSLVSINTILGLPSAGEDGGAGLCFAPPSSLSRSFTEFVLLDLLSLGTRGDTRNSAQKSRSPQLSAGCCCCHYYCF